MGVEAGQIHVKREIGRFKGLEMPFGMVLEQSRANFAPDRFEGPD